MKPFLLLIKPASADCNLRCPYCFYSDRSGLYPESRVHRMSDEVLDRMVSSYMATQQPQYLFSWQGGEPTLMGVDFFRRVTELQQKYGRSGTVVGNALQTNGVLIDREFADHLARYKFLVGLSLDGPQDVHDQYRVHVDGPGSHADVMRAIRTFRESRVEFNILTLVTSANVRKAREVYRYLRELGIEYHQYIPCVEFDEDGSPLPWTITGEEWGDFLCELFDEWEARDTRKISVRLFDAILGMLVEDEPSLCTMGTDCREYLVVEHNGDVYPCDFFVQEGLRLGSVITASWEEMRTSPKYSEFGKSKRNWHESCSACEFLRYCAGDCLKHRPGNARSWLCEGWKRFYAHSLPRFRALAEQIKSQRAVQSPATLDAVPRIARVGRNDLCPCGSGKKYKKCHGAQQ